MAETPEGREKTEPATSRRITEARQRGQVAKSIDITNTVMIILGGFLTLLYINVIVRNLRSFFENSITTSFHQQITTQEIVRIFTNSVLFIAQTILPLLILMYFLVLVSEIAQVGFHIATKKFTKGLNFRTIFNPLGGLKRILFSGRAYFELVKSIMKLLVLGWIAYSVLKKHIYWDLSLIEKPVWEIPKIMVTVTFELIAKVGAIYALIAFGDMMYQKYRYKEDLKMTKEEVKEEARQSEGDPMVKSRIRGLMRQRIRKIILKNLEKRADVVVTNPTHFAVALEYKPYKMSAPVVVAKGVDFLALKIREIAEAKGIPIVEEPPLAQALYFSVDVEEEIPEFLFKAVAQVLAYVYYL
ncbi:MAG: EscU/YscU/HrcU family type III secretion system export apparatus switch protein, partial [Candidatus Kapaibacteriota bacterium]